MKDTNTQVTEVKIDPNDLYEFCLREYHEAYLLVNPTDIMTQGFVWHLEKYINKNCIKENK